MNFGLGYRFVWDGFTGMPSRGERGERVGICKDRDGHGVRFRVAACRGAISTGFARVT